MLPLRLGWNLSLLLPGFSWWLFTHAVTWLIVACLTFCLCQHMASSLCVSVFTYSFLSIQDASHIGLEPTLMASSQLDCTHRDLISKQGHVHRCRGQDLSIIFSEDTIQPITIILPYYLYTVCRIYNPVIFLILFMFLIFIY